MTNLDIALLKFVAICVMVFALMGAALAFFILSAPLKDVFIAAATAGFTALVISSYAALTGKAGQKEDGERG